MPTLAPQRGWFGPRFPEKFALVEHGAEVPRDVHGTATTKGLLPSNRCRSAFRDPDAPAGAHGAVDAAA